MRRFPLEMHFGLIFLHEYQMLVNVEKILYDFYLYLILISIMDEGSTIKVI